MKKFSIFAMAVAAMAFTACGNKNAQPETTEVEKSFEQEQVEAKIKVELDSLAAEVGKLKQLPFMTTGDDGIKLSDAEKQVKPEYLLAPAVADSAVTLSEKYRMISALSVDKNVAALYDMPVEEYDAAIAKLVADINDPSFKDLDTATLFETGQKLYDQMNENGRINYFWQMVASSLVEEVYVLSENSDKFLAAFDDDSASGVTYRITLLSDAVERLGEYDADFEPVANAVKALKPLNAISVDQLKTQLAETKEKIAEARATLIK